MKIGLISDTHGFLDERVFHYFEDMDEIWHAGDIGTEELLIQLRQFKPTVAVWGNIDGGKLRQECQEIVYQVRGGIEILMIHIAGKPPRYNEQVRELIATHRPKLLICGHSHILKVEHDKNRDLLFMNPGAAGRHGFHKVRTLLRFEILDERITNLEVVELGPRSSAQDTSSQ